MTGLATTRRGALVSALAGAGALAFGGGARAHTGAAAAAIDAFARAVLAANPEQPGLGIAVVEDGEVTLARGYGVRTLGEAARCDETTPFGIASNTKAMTGALLGMLAEEGRLDWNAPVSRYLPEFAVGDETVRGLLTVRDLVSHRVGLGLGAGDLMLWPTPKGRSRAQLVRDVRRVPVANRFRDHYDYQNVLFVVAGAVVEAIEGRSWEASLRARILGPLGMADSAPTPLEVDRARAARGHARLGPPIRGVGPQKPLTWYPQFDTGAPAGGVWASPRDIAKWMQVQLALGALPGGGRLWSEATARDLWRPQTIVSFSEGPTADNPARPSIGAYATGWFVQDHRGERTLGHGGGLAGFISYTALLPGRRSGIMIMTNAEEGAVQSALRFGGLDRLQGRSDFDWIAARRKVADQGRDDGLKQWAEREAARAKGTPPPLPLDAYVGTYVDPWYGPVTVRRAGRGLAIAFERSEMLAGPLEPWDGNTFRTRYPNPDMEDALVTFEIEGGRAARARAEALSPLADFSFDYQDLRLERAA